MTRIVGNVLLPNGELATRGIVQVKLNKEMISAGKLYTTATQTFPVVNGSVDITLAPNEGASPADTFYNVVVDVGNGAQYLSTWYVNNQATQEVFISTVSTQGPKFVEKDDPVYLALITDTGNTGVPDILEATFPYDEVIDSTSFNGILTTFATEFEFLPGSLKLFINGVRAEKGNSDPGEEKEFYEGNDNQSFVTTLAPNSVDYIYVEYLKA